MGEVVKDVVKIFRYFTPKWMNIVLTVEESKNLDALKVEKLIGFLLTHVEKVKCMGGLDEALMSKAKISESGSK